jgi:hypothetical protein
VSFRDDLDPIAIHVDRNLVVDRIGRTADRGGPPLRLG